MSSSTSRSSFLVVNQRGKRGRPGFGATKGTATGDRRVYPGEEQHGSLPGYETGKPGGDHKDGKWQ